MSPSNTLGIVLFSGGTDSMATAAKLAQEYKELHLLTFFDLSNKKSPTPVGSLELLKKKFPEVKFVHKMINTDGIIKSLVFENYLMKTLKYRLYMTISCGFTSLSWHLAALQYALDNKIYVIADGMTREMTHLPGHMPQFIQNMSTLYSRYNIAYQNTVIDWDTYEEKSIEDRFIINQHNYMFPSENALCEKQKTTGAYLYEHGIFPSKDIKGSKFDQSLQHDCYPFVLYNLLYFWFFRFFYTKEKIESLISIFFNDRAKEYTQKHFYNLKEEDIQA